VGGVVPGSVAATQLLIDVLRAHLDAYDAVHGIVHEHDWFDDEDPVRAA
jgi:hypothetical protein